MIRENLFYNAPVEEDSLGLAPDTMLVFYERYLAEHPDWDESREGMQAYTDALGYYLRDEIGIETVPDTLPEKPVINEEYAVKALKDQMTDYWGWQWDTEAVEAMVPQVEWDETCRMWTVSGEVSDESMEKATDLRKDMNPVKALRIQRFLLKPLRREDSPDCGADRDRDRGTGADSGTNGSSAR